MARSVLALAMLAMVATADLCAASEVWPVAGACVIRVESAELASAAGRAEFLAAVERVAQRGCAGQHPHVAAERCRADLLAQVEAQLPPCAMARLRQARLER